MKKISKRTIYILVIIGIVLLTWLVVWLFFKLYDKNVAEGKIKDARVTNIAKNVQDYVNQYKYSAISMTMSEAYPGEEVAYANYVITCDKDSEEHSYVCLLDNTEYLQYWNVSEGTGNYDVYLKTSKNDEWVYAKSDKAPMYYSGWDFVKDLENAFLVTEDGIWYDDETECYILELLSSSDTYAIIYSQYYIRKSDYAPVGIIAYAVDSIDNDDVKLKDQRIISVGELDVSQETYIPDHREKVEMCDLKYSTEDLKLFGKPDKYITVEEYQNREKEVK